MEPTKHIVKPITPDEVDKGQHIPDFVIQAFNELIAEAWEGREATVVQKDAVARCIKVAKVGGERVTSTMLFYKGWLNVEGFYRNAGWDVVYDKPGYNESYEATFCFTRAR